MLDLPLDQQQSAWQGMVDRVTRNGNHEVDWKNLANEARMAVKACDPPFGQAWRFAYMIDAAPRAKTIEKLAILADELGVMTDDLFKMGDERIAFLEGTHDDGTHGDG